MKRSRSGARPSGTSGKNVAKAHVRYKYELCTITPDGEICEPTADDLAYFEQRFPTIAKKLRDSVTNAGFEAGSWQEKCFRILEGIVKQKRATWFRVPVDPVKEGLQDYFTVIKSPMDLNTVKTRLQGGGYAEASEFAAHVRLTFNNAMTYNRAGTVVHEDASKLLSQFEKKYALEFDPASLIATAPPSAAIEAGGADELGELAGGSAGGAAGGEPGGGAAGDDDFAAAPGPSDSNWEGDDDEFGEPSQAEPTMKPVMSDSDEDEDDDDEEDGGVTGETDGEPSGAGQQGGKHPTSGGKAPAGMEDDSAFDETAESEADLSDSALDSEAEEGDDGISEAEMFGEEEDDDEYEFDEGGDDGAGGDSQMESEAEGYGGGSSSMPEGDDGDSFDDAEGSEFD